jgi:predicted nucleotidyltransferase
MSEELELLKLIAERLDAAGIAYMMTGSMAMALYTTPRMTRDIDLVVQLFPLDVSRMVALFKDEFYIDESSVKAAIESRGMFNIIHNEYIIKIDFIVRKDDVYRLEEFARRQNVMIDGVTVSVATVEDVILSKLVWAAHSGSELQLRDVKSMLSATHTVDTVYLERWSKYLSVDSQLKRVMLNA